MAVSEKWEPVMYRLIALNTNGTISTVSYRIENQDPVVLTRGDVLKLTINTNDLVDYMERPAPSPQKEIYKDMSYDICLKDPVTKETLQLDQPHHMKGGTYQLGGTTKAHLNITYNYSKCFAKVLPQREPDGYPPAGIRTIYGLTGAESIPVLKQAISQLGDDVTEDYWTATEGNAKRALSQLLALAYMRPDGVWDGD